MTKKIIFAGACTLIILAAMWLFSEIALMERGYSAAGGEILVPVIAFCIWAAVKTVKDIRKVWNNGEEV